MLITSWFYLRNARSVTVKEQSEHEPVTSLFHDSHKQISWSQSGLILTGVTHNPAGARQNGKINFQHDCLQTLWHWSQINNNWAGLSLQTASIKPREEGSGSQWKRSSRFSLISVVNLSSLSQFGGLSVQCCHTSTSDEALLVSISHTDKHIYNSGVAARALRVVTASQQHGFPLMVLCGRQELHCCSRELSSPPVWTLLLLNHHPLKSRTNASSPAAHHMPVHGPSAEAIKLLTSASLLLLLPPLPPLKIFSPNFLLPEFFPAAPTHSYSLHSPISLCSAAGLPSM